MINESTISLLVVASEVGAGLAVILIVLIFFMIRSRMKKKAMARDLVNKVKHDEVAHRAALANKVKSLTNLDDAKVDEVIATIMNCEKRLYNRMVNAYMGYNDAGIDGIDKEVNNLSNSFIGLVEQSASATPTKSAVSESEELEIKKQVSRLREEKVLLKEKNAQLQADFDAAMESMERMTLEYAQMYEGGQKDGELRLKNEMYQLKQKLSTGNKHSSGDDDPESA